MRNQNFYSKTIRKTKAAEDEWKPHFLNSKTKAMK